ncbi:hypothetical protein NH26_16955 [Flammeovirga pacifica]|uniref:Uncharacterized protein n=1 Tax=Flammeovirga pacifica TaxID=915059 RepID=A0A1S1Z3P2_FLAPC|nr:hypothetical protein NH26_16955 [Flammeovirga pacifica]
MKFVYFFIINITNVVRISSPFYVFKHTTVFFYTIKQPAKKQVFIFTQKKVGLIKSLLKGSKRKK